MPNDSDLDSRFAVLTSWGLWGSFGLGFVLTGFRSGLLGFGLAGFALLAAGFVSHVIVNRVYGRTFTDGEIASALGLFGLAVLGFVISWLLDPGLDRTSVTLALTGCTVGVAGFFAYVATRYGLRGAFSMFHHTKRQL